MPKSERRASPVDVYLCELSPGSRRTMRFGLRSACQFFGGRDPHTFLWYRAATELSCAPRAVWRLLAAGHLIGVRVGKRGMRVDRASLDAFIAKGGSK